MSPCAQLQCCKPLSLFAMANTQHVACNTLLVPCQMTSNIKAWRSRTFASSARARCGSSFSNSSLNAASQTSSESGLAANASARMALAPGTSPAGDRTDSRQHSCCCVRLLGVLWVVTTCPNSLPRPPLRTLQVVHWTRVNCGVESAATSQL